MNFIDLIEKKKNRQSLTREELHFFIQNYVNDKIPDYQVSALLMAICLNGMSEQETAWLCEEMVGSGDVLDLSAIHGIVCDKHSTGGVGDKTSLAMLPMVVACGANIAKMSGRGLGHTGGTLDKLESIQGFRTELSQRVFIDQVNEIGLAIMGQNRNLVPADKKLYALRDVTATVDSIPLIASSIMSKKLAAGSDTILLDVKYGTGAFMKTIEQAEALAVCMINIGKHFHKDVRAMISDMNQPLGNAIGNALEVKEAILTLQGQGPKDFTELCRRGGSIMLQQATLAENDEEALAMLDDVILTGAAFKKFLAMVQAQSGNYHQLLHPETLPQAQKIITLKSKDEGYLKGINASLLGTLSMQLGAGRMKLDDLIDPSAGLILRQKIGAYVKKNDILAEVHTNTELTQDWIHTFYRCYSYSKTPVEEKPLIQKIVQ